MSRVHQNHALRILLAVVVGLALVGGCGGDDGGAEPLDATTVDSQGCDDWNAATPEEQAGLVRDLGYAEETAAIPDVVGLIVEGVDNFCASPDAEAELGLGGAISGTALAIGVEPAP
jgi:hypothetical protein